MGSRRVGLARTQALIENLKRELDMNNSTLTDVVIDSNGTLINKTHISSSLNISGAAFYANGVKLTAGGGGDPAGSDTQIQFNEGGSSFGASSNFVWDDTNLKVIGNISSSLNISSSALYAGNNLLELAESNSGHAQIKVSSAHMQIRNSANNKDIRIQIGDDAGSTKVQVRNDSGNGVAQIDSYGDSEFRNISASTNISASAFYGDTRYTATSLANNEGSGEVVSFGTGTTTKGKTYYLHSNGAWDQVTNAVAASGGLGMLATALGTSPASDGMLLRGFFDYNTYLEGDFTVGATVYITGSGYLTTIAPSSSGEILRVIGTCSPTANVIYFNPSPDYMVIK